MKTKMVVKLARKAGVKVERVKLTRCEPEDIGGLPARKSGGGSWRVQITGCPMPGDVIPVVSKAAREFSYRMEPGDEITVTTKDGRSWTTRVARVVCTDDAWTLVATSSE